MNSDTRSVTTQLKAATIVASADIRSKEVVHDLQQQPDTSVLTADNLDPHMYLRLQMRVLGGQSKSLGKVAAIEREAVTGLLTSLTVRHGLLGNRRTSVPVEHVKWVNQDSVVLQLSQTNFKRLPQVTGH